MYFDKKKHVYDILITSVECTGYSNGKQEISKSGSIIKSTQTYYPFKNYPITLDPDMSDFAIGFYKIIYKDILRENGILNVDSLVDDNFAGDTMNSFNNITNCVKGAGRTKAKRTPYDTWPDFLKNYHDQYTCLANFWILPKELGRVNNTYLSKGYYDYTKHIGAQDYMDKFLGQVKMEWEKYCSKYSYFKRMRDFKIFAEINFLVGSYVNSDMEIYKYSIGRTPEEIIDAVQDKIHLRATVISESQYCDELWTYFYNCGLIEC